MPASNPTFEEVDKHIQSADLSAFQTGGKHAATKSATAAALPGNVCAAYHIVRPILILLENTPFIPKKWKDAIKAFVGVLDAICP